MNDHYWSSGNALMNMVRVVWFFSQTVAPVTEVTVSCCCHIRQRLGNCLCLVVSNIPVGDL